MSTHLHFFCEGRIGTSSPSKASAAFAGGNLQRPSTEWLFGLIFRASAIVFPVTPIEQDISPPLESYKFTMYERI